MFDCNSASNCEYAMYRQYDATANGNSCVKNSDYTDDFYAVDNCFSTKKWVCDATQLSFEQYYFNIIDNSQDDDDCLQAAVSTSPVVQAGCADTNSEYIEILNCSPLQPTTTMMSTTTVGGEIPTDTTSASVTYNYSLISIVIVFLIVSCVAL
eukprot:UN12209